jgi:hypothetical protein
MAKAKASKSIVFTERFKHGRIDFHPGVPYAFEDGRAALYFKNFGCAKPSNLEPSVTLSAAECQIDPGTVFGFGPNKGQKILEA